MYNNKGGEILANETKCDICMNYEYDEEYDCYVCGMDLDMDEAERFITFSFKDCPYFRPGDEYTIVKKQN